MSTDIVPFGKYRGQPVEVLAADKSYCDWLLAQDWFRVRYAAVHTLIVNNFAEPSCTPEHNELQAKFLDRALCYKLALAQHDLSIVVDQRVAEMRRRLSPSWHSELLQKFNELLLSYPGAVFYVSKPQFEHYGADVHYYYTITLNAIKANIKEWPESVDLNYYKELSVQLKPSLGDDYPAVIRAMRTAKCNCLVYGSYCGVGATIEQVRTMFSDVWIGSLAEVEAIDLSGLPTLLSISREE